MVPESTMSTRGARGEGHLDIDVWGTLVNGGVHLAQLAEYMNVWGVRVYGRQSGSCPTAAVDVGWQEDVGDKGGLKYWLRAYSPWDHHSAEVADNFQDLLRLYIACVCSNDAKLVLGHYLTGFRG